jgi:hypothetical protein
VKWLLSAFLTVAILLPVPAAAAPPPRDGLACTKVGQVKSYKAKKFTCTKQGKKLVWKVKRLPVAKVAPAIPQAPAPALVPPLMPTGFNDVFERRAGIPLAAWTAVANAIAGSPPRQAVIEFHSGPNTRPSPDDYSKVVDLVARAFPSFAITPRLVVLRFSYADLAWAEAKMRELVNEWDYEALQRNESGRLVDGLCQPVQQSCPGAKQVGVNAAVAYILEGDQHEGTTGIRAAHEYFHSLQRLTTMGKVNAAAPWRTRWLLEGSAQWASHAVIQHESVDRYQSGMRGDCEGACRTLTDAQISEFLQMGSRAHEKYDQWLDYSLGARIVEVLVAVNGHETILKLHETLAEGATFEVAFKNLYGIHWDEAIPVIAKVIAAGIADGR